MIADLHHLTAPMLKTFVRAKGAKRIILVSDCTRIAGLKPGKYVGIWRGSRVETERAALPQRHRFTGGQRDAPAGRRGECPARYGHDVAADFCQCARDSGKDTRGSAAAPRVSKWAGAPIVSCSSPALGNLVSKRCSWRGAASPQQMEGRKCHERTKLARNHQRHGASPGISRPRYLG